MSWDILPKSNLQYFLQKLKDKFDGKADNSDVIETDTQNSTPFLYRETPYEADRVFLDELVGGSVAWNQLVSHGNFDETTDWSGNGASISVSNNIGNITFSSATGKAIHNVNAIANHVYLTIATLKATASNSMPTLASYIGSSGIFKYISQNVTSFQTVYILEKQSSIFSVPQIQIRNAQNPLPSDSDIQVKNVMCFDLTQMFGSTIADYIYSLEQTTAGSGIAWLKSHGFFTKDYYPYNAGELISVKTSGKKYVGFNQWDEQWEVGNIDDIGNTGSSAYRFRSKNFIPCLPSTNYYFKDGSDATARLFFYDENNSFISYNVNPYNSGFTTPSNCHFLKFRTKDDVTTYNHDICINISKPTGTPKNGDYVPYEEHTYDISNIDLRGIPKLVNNELVYDGDTYESDGNVTRKYNLIDLGEKYWSRHTDGAIPYFRITLSDSTLSNTKRNFLCEKYEKVTFSDIYVQGKDKACASYTDGVFFISDMTYSTEADFKAAMSGVHLIYELATPTTETTDPYINPQTCDKDGTEEFIDNRTVPIPVGHNSTYANLPSMMDGDFLNYMARNFASEEYVDTELDTKVDKVTGKGLSANDYTNEEKALVATVPNKADTDDVKGTQTATGNPITLTDASETYAQGLSVELEPIQDLHGQSAPYVGGAGGNLFNMGSKISSATHSGLNISSDDDCLIVNGTKYGASYYDPQELEFTLPSGTYYARSFASGISTATLSVYVMNGTTAVTGDIKASERSFTLEEETTLKIRFAFWTDNAQYTNYKISVVISKTSGIDSYIPYANICPISGYEGVEVEDVGKNRFDESVMADTAVATWGYAEIQLEPNTSYIMSSPDCNSYLADNTEPRLYFYIQEGTADTPNMVTKYNFVTQTTGADGIARIQWLTETPGKPITDYHFMLNIGTLSQAYEPFKSRTASVTFGQTVYGGRSDFTEGGTDDDRNEVMFDGSSDEGWVKSADNIFYIALNDLRKSSDYSSVILCDRLKTVANHSSTYLTSNCITGYNDGGNTYPTQNWLYIYVSGITDVSGLKTWLASNNLQVVYEKATPSTISTPPTDLKLLQDTNNLTTNGTTITLDYIPNNSIGDAVKASEEYTDRAVERVIPKAKLVGFYEIYDESGTLYDVTIPTTTDANFILFEYRIQSRVGSTLIPSKSSYDNYISVDVNNGGNQNWIEFLYNSIAHTLTYTSNITTGFGVLSIYAI